MEEYAAPSPPFRPTPEGIAAAQMVLPDCLSNAASMACGEPGVQITRSSSTSTDSENPQPDIICPPKSREKFLRHNSLPFWVSAQSRSPSNVTPNTRLPA